MKKRVHTPNRESSMEISEIPAEVAENLGFYVYLYIDPRNGQIKYVGKGTGRRATAHLNALLKRCRELGKGAGKGVVEHLADNRKVSEKTKWIEELNDAGLSPRIDILSRRLKKKQAFIVERSVIDVLGIPPLTNKVRGHGTEQGRESLREIITWESAEETDIQHPVLLFRLNKSFHKNMSEEEIYEATRGFWRIGTERRQKAQYAFGVFKGIVRGVFSIYDWHKGLSTEYKFRPDIPFDEKNKRQWEFTSNKGNTPQEIIDMYLHKSVRKHFKKGDQSSFRLVEP